MTTSTNVRVELPVDAEAGDRFEIAKITTSRWPDESVSRNVDLRPVTDRAEASPALVGERPAPSEEAGRVTLTPHDVRRIVREELAIVTANREAAEKRAAPAPKRTSPLRRLLQNR